MVPGVRCLPFIQEHLGECDYSLEWATVLIRESREIITGFPEISELNR
jgi:hypothetical protein